ELREARHEVVGCRVAFRRSPPLHRALWHAYYGPRSAWRRRWPDAWTVYAPLASYASLLSWRFLRELAAERPDFLFTQDYARGRCDVLCAAARWLGIPLAASPSGSRPEWYQGRLAKRATRRAAHRLLVSSREEARQLASQFGVDPARIELF